MECFDAGECTDTLNQKGTRFQERSRYGYFEYGTAQAGCVRNDRYKGAVLYSKGNADDYGGPGLSGQTEVNEPDFTASRLRHRRYLETGKALRKLLRFRRR